jgi:hypothetical protein
VGDIEPSERLYWSWQEVRQNLGRGLVYGLPGGLLVGLLGVLQYGVIAGVLLGLVGVLVGVLSYGTVHDLRDERATPNEGIRRSAKNALVCAVVCTLVFVFVGVLVGEPLAGLGLGLLGGLLFGLLFGGGACLQHYVIRAALVHRRVVPRHYERFLEAMKQRLLLRQSGSAYLFVHRLLRDHLAEGQGNTTLPVRNVQDSR